MFDQNEVRVSIEEVLGSFAAAHGFTARGDFCWRRSSEKVDVLEVEFPPRENLNPRGLPSGSFLVRGGCYFPDIPPFGKWRVDGLADGDLRPRPEDCPIVLEAIKPRRASIFPFAPPVYLYGPERNIWYVGSKPELLSAKKDVERKLGVIDHLMSDTFASMEAVLTYLRTHDEDVDASEIAIHGFGRPNSPKKNYIVGLAAFRLGDWRLAQQTLAALLEVVDQGGLRRVSPQSDSVKEIREMISACKSRTAAH